MNPKLKAPRRFVATPPDSMHPGLNAILGKMAAQGPTMGRQGPSFGPRAPSGQALGSALDIRQVADMLGCSPWTVRQKLIPKGLPHLRFAASGKLHFYAEQVVRWVENQQKGG